MRTNREKSDRYKAQLARVREIVNRHDPIGLMACGCPEDEYDPEVTRIVPLLDRCGDRLSFRDLCITVFTVMFYREAVERFTGWDGLIDELWEGRAAE